MMILNDSNLSNIIATGIVVYSNTSEIVAEDQIKTMEYFERTNLYLFNSMKMALIWAKDLIHNP
jgi:hypothetical protein